MIFGKLENNTCINIIVFDTKEQAENFDNTLVEVAEGFGIGDDYIDGAWSKHIKTVEERIADIDKELIKIDNRGVTRHLENQIEASGTYEIIYTSTKELIDKKNQLRVERKELQSLTKEGE